MAKVKIITDSAADVPADIAERYDIEIVPLTIRFDATEYTDGVELTREDFWQRIGEKSELPSTSAPSPGQFEEAFRRAANDGFESVVCLCLSSAISATHQIATTAARAVADEITVHVIDTQACTIAQQTLVLDAARLAAESSRAEAIVAAVDELKTRVHLYGALDTLDNLRKGGRIGAANAFFGSLLSVKPIVGLVGGEVKAVGKTRTRSKALDYLANELARHPDAENVIIGHAYAPDIEDIERRFAAAIGRNSIPVSVIGPVVGTHTGPRLTAISFVTPRAAS